MIDHSTAVRIAQSGEGAVVSELMRLSREVERLTDRIKHLYIYINDLEGNLITLSGARGEGMSHD